ncbi:hypothetical protein [Stygiolobus caldivivus]|uniref:Uncharacterized protein n=1 Tax=Stygiolobus caldivivus TaxID=2824673 RepID=A0A8D5U422_9CREN|nr:hypothetical protein [Stygiolobus caldivivus]BCU68884.1 hypothetical protein KN1_01810 [Stygiolobus caldivivus]
MKVYEGGVKYKRVFLILALNVVIFVSIPTLLSMYKNIPGLLFTLLEYIFDISFFCLIFFGILTVIAINKGKIKIYDSGIEIRKFRRTFLSWNEIKGVDSRYKSLTVSLLTRKLVSRRVLEIYTVEGKTLTVEVSDPEKIINIIKGIKDREKEERI